jgi:hypothetical protein
MFFKMVIRIITIIAMVCLIQNNAIAQEEILEKKISFSVQNENLLSVIKKLNKKLNGVFSFQESLIPSDKMISYEGENKKVKEILDEILFGTQIGYTEYAGKIILNLKTKLQKFTLSGTISDQSTGEVLIGANLFIQESSIGTTTNQYGFYSLTVDEGNYTFIVSFLGYKTKTFSDTKVENHIRLNIELEPTSLDLAEVVVEDKKLDQNVKSIEIGVNEFKPQVLEAVPIIFGEQDILKTIQLMPGVSSAGEGSSGFFVRGGAIDQNQILLDEATVYNPSHLLGFFSTFNSDALNNVKLIKGNFPAEYGGRLASVMDIKMKEGNKKNFDAYGGIGLIASRLTLEGPILINKSSFIISGRRTYIDVFFPDTLDLKLYFYDLNAKANYILGENDRLYVSGFIGRDVFEYTDETDLFGFNWGNITSTIRWNHIFGDKLFMNLTGIYSKYDYDIKGGNVENNYNINSGIQDLNFKADFEYYQRDGNTVKFGTQVVKHLFTPGEISISGTTQFNSIKIREINSFESALYASHEYKYNERLSFNYGLRLSNYSVVGPGNIYSFNELGEGETEYKESGILKSYFGFEPRFSSVYLLENSNSIKFALSRNMQYLHLISNSTSGTPFDIWQSSTNNVKPGISDQVSLGYFQNFSNNMYEFSVEAYYKNLQNQIDFKSGAELTLNEFVEGELVFGKGRAYGIEVMLKKNIGEFTGWLGYTLSRSEREFPDIDEGKVFPAKQDRTHDISIVGMYNLNDTWNFSLNWIYYTGSAVTFPSGKYNFEGNVVNYYTSRNGYRMPDYHRLDLGITYNFSSSHNLNFSLYNVYGRKNAYAILFREKENNPNQTEAVRFALFSIVPSITYNFNF